MKVLTHIIKDNDENVLSRKVNSALEEIQSNGLNVIDIKYDVAVMPQYLIGTDLNWNFKPIYSALIIYGREKNKNISEKPLDK